MIVIDASVLVKLASDEDGRDKARELVAWATKNNIPIRLPALVKFEVANAFLRKGYGAQTSQRIFSDYLPPWLDLSELKDGEWARAEAIHKSGHPKSGFPSFYDAVYHALAIENQGTLITADVKYLAKARGLGSVIALEDWQDLTTRS